MKKITLLISTFFLSVIVTNAAVTLPMDYSNFFAASAINSGGTTLETGNAAALNTWYLAGTANGSSPALSNTLLSYSNYVDNTNGKKIVLSSAISATRTSFFQFTANATDLPGNRTYYLSFLLNVSSAPSSYALLVNFINGTTSGGHRGRIQIKANAASGATGYYLQPIVSSTGGTATALIPFNSTHLIVLKYDITTASSTSSATDGTATATIFVDPTIAGSEPSSTSTVTQSATANLDCIKSLVMYQQPGLGAEISGLRFSSTWADVCKASPAVKLTTPTTNAANPVSSTGFTANWNAVSNAQNYNLAIYQNGVQVGSTITGISGTSYAVSGLNNFTTYTYKVTAVGDGSSYSNSDPSAAQSVTTTDPNAVSGVNINFADGTWTSLTGTYSDVSTNGYDFIKTRLTTANYYGSKGELHTKYVDIDNKTNGGKMTLPTVNSLAQIEIHAATGTAERTFDLKEYNTTTGAYDLIATYTYNTLSKNAGLDSVYIINISRATPTKFRIENSGFGGMSVMQVITRATALTSLSSPTASAPAQVTNTGFRASWTQVANATGYEIRVFQGSAVRKAVTVNDGATLTADVTGLTPNTTYFYRVAAIADGTGYLNSFLSASGGSFTTANEFSVSSATSSSALTSLNSSSAITIQSGNTFTVNTNAIVDNIVLQAGAKLTLSTGNTLTATNGITLQSSSSGTATFVDNNNTSPQSVSGTVEQHLASARNWYLSSPIAGATIPAGQTYYSYDETGSNTGFVAPASFYWVAVPEGTTINPMKGYITQPGAATTKSYTGTFNTGTKTIALTRTNSASKPGFNLVANPYPSYLDWSMVDTTAANIQTSVWYRTKTSGGAYTFDTYNGKLDVATANGENTVSKLIPPMQAFWVRVKTGFAGGTLTFDNTMRKHADVSGNKMKAPKLSETKVVRLQLSNGTNADEALVCFNSNAQNSFDSYDSPKMFESSATRPELYTLAGNEKVVINGLSELNGVNSNMEIPLGVTYTQGGNLKLKLTELSNFDSNTKVYLRDKVDIAEIELTPETEYTFNTTATSNNESRFILIFRASGISTEVENTTTKLKAQVFVNAANQITIIAPEKSNYTIYNAVGQLIENGILKSELQTVNCKLQTGIFVVKVNNQSTRVIIK